MTTLTALEQQREDQALGAAWRRVEAALPGGADRATLFTIDRSLARSAADRYEADVEFDDDPLPGPLLDEPLYGATPAAALDALADALEKAAAE